ncbi:BMP family protein [Oceanibium sediminis]|uniref:BMP family protein n=1 Tax=Oceanibium sediminis TaxID=2026339 RepID=UPI000DD34A08|nr:BMP family protein [Oceanibium sediminis]
MNMLTEMNLGLPTKGAVTGAVLGVLMFATAGAALAEMKAAVIFGVANPVAVNGWDRGQFEGVQKLIDDHGWDVTVAEAVPFPGLANTAENYAKSDYDVVIFTSSGHIKAWNEVAPKYPDTLFVMMSTTSSLPESDNVLAYTSDFYAYGVVNGLVAGLATETDKIAAIGGVPVQALEDMFSGIVESSKIVNPDIEVLTAFSGDWTGIPRAREVSVLQIQQGADIVIGNAGVGTRGILDAVQSTETQFVGYATDWTEDAPETVLTSVLMNIPSWYEQLAQDVESGALTPRIELFGAESFALTPFNDSISAETAQKITDYVDQYVNGELDVPKVNHSFK